MDVDKPQDESSNCDHVFVLRCWREKTATGSIDPDWRVQLSHGYTRERIHVFGIESAFELVREILGKCVETKEDTAP